MEFNTESVQNLHIISSEESEPAVIFNSDDVDVEDNEGTESPVSVCFIEKPNGPKDLHYLLPQHFPNKAGGTPAWLDPVNLPSGKSSSCDFCGNPLRFVLQVYAPIPSKETAYHRSLFVFMCPSMTCLLLDQHEQEKDRTLNPKRSVKVFRCQLPKDNAFYQLEEPEGCGGTFDSQCAGGMQPQLCHWCGTWKGETCCDRCRKAYYCSKKHQELHWRASHERECHQMLCSPNASTSILECHERVFVVTSWPEYILSDESEKAPCLNNFGSNSSELSVVHGQNNSDDMLSLMDEFEVDADNRCWASFLERTSRHQHQVLRYCWDETAKPVWAVSCGSLTNDAAIPLCIYCNGPLCYEFQIMPQLLYYFHVENEADSIDWGTIIVYTCLGSCDGNVSYKEEFVSVQLYPATRTTYRGIQGLSSPLEL